MFANFCIDLFVTAATFGNLIGSNYFLRIAPGSNLITAMVAAFQSGRDIWREKYIKDLASYLLTLPISRRMFALSRITGGVARSVIATFPGTLVISYLYGILFSPRLIEAFVIVAYDVSLFPAIVQPIVETNPMTWAMQAFRALQSQGSTLYPISILVGPSLAFALLGAVCYLWYTRL